jgi:hypothetical protein
MKPKQLANVLIKILGLSFCVDGVVRAASGILNLFAMLTIRNGLSSVYIWLNPLSGLLLAVIGFLFIVLSRPIADFLFKDEAE